MRFAVVVSALVVLAAGTSGLALAPASPRQQVIYVGGSQSQPSMARIDVHGPGTRGHVLEVMYVYGPTSMNRGFCAPPTYTIGEDADLIELAPGTYRVTAKAERRAPASAFPAAGDVTVTGGVCYAPVMTCDGDATDGATCHLSLKPKDCAPLRSPRRVFLPSVSPC